MTEKRMRKLTVLLPALNEEAGIGEVIDSIPINVLRSAGFDVEIVVVDGNSTDKTREIAAEKGARVVVQEGRGKGRGVRMAFDMIDSDYIVMMDADGTYPTVALPAFVEILERGADVVMGSRFAGGIEGGAMSGVNMIGNRILTLIASTLYWREVTDVCTGMCGFSRKAIRSFHLNSTGFELEAEIFAQSAKSYLVMKEVPVHYSRRKGTPKLGSLSSGFRIGFKLIKMRLVAQDSNPGMGTLKVE